MNSETRNEKIITAAEVARAFGIDPKRFRSKLRGAGLAWHSHNDRWQVRIGSPEHNDMLRVLEKTIEPSA